MIDPHHAQRGQSEDRRLPGSGGEEKLIVLAGVPVVAELKCPNLVDDDRLAVSIAQSAEESARGGIEGVDTAVRNIVGDQQSIAERAEIARGHRHTPRRMQWAGDSREHLARGIKLDHKARG